MAKRVQDMKPARKADAQAWMKENIVAQEKRYAEIVAEMDSIDKDRDRWYAEFLEIVATRGWNTHAAERSLVKRKDLPKKPKGHRNRVVW